MFGPISCPNSPDVKFTVSLLLQLSKGDKAKEEQKLLQAVVTAQAMGKTVAVIVEIWIWFVVSMATITARLYDQTFTLEMLQGHGQEY